MYKGTKYWSADADWLGFLKRSEKLAEKTMGKSAVLSARCKQSMAKKKNENAKSQKT